MAVNYISFILLTWKASKSASAVFKAPSMIFAFFTSASDSFFKDSLVFFSSANSSSRSKRRSRSWQTLNRDIKISTHVNQSSDESINQSTSQSLSQPINQQANQFVNMSINQLRNSLVLKLKIRLPSLPELEPHDDKLKNPHRNSAKLISVNTNKVKLSCSSLLAYCCRSLFHCPQYKAIWTLLVPTRRDVSSIEGYIQAIHPVFRTICKYPIV